MSESRLFQIMDAGFLSEYTPEDGFYSGLFNNRNGSFFSQCCRGFYSVRYAESVS